MAYDSNLKSSRFLQGRRYTHNNLSDSQESFTSVLDLNSNEIYVDQGLIPSNNLPFNSSEDNLKTYVDPTTGFNVMKYWFRHKLTKSDLNNELQEATHSIQEHIYKNSSIMFHYSPFPLVNLNQNQ